MTVDKIELLEGGPIIVRGSLGYIETETDNPAVNAKTIALCRCGKSETKPFCDGAHKALVANDGLHLPGDAVIV